MRLDLIKKPEGEWASYNEFCGIGDGVTKEFKTPIPPKEARSVIVLRGFNIVPTDNRIVTMNDKDGTILKDEADGYKLEAREDDLWVVFDRAPAFETRVWVSGLGRKVGEAFFVLPMNTILQKKIQEKQPAALKGKDRDKATVLDLQDAGRVSFEAIVTDWTGVNDQDGQPVPCNAEMRKKMLDDQDAFFLGFFASNRSSALRAERMQAHAKDSSD
jgi:hypothetical protein